jgi:hypothetical protein
MLNHARDGSLLPDAALESGPPPAVAPPSAPLLPVMQKPDAISLPPAAWVAPAVEPGIATHATDPSHPRATNDIIICIPLLLLASGPALHSKRWLRAAAPQAAFPTCSCSKAASCPPLAAACKLQSPSLGRPVAAHAALSCSSAGCRPAAPARCASSRAGCRHMPVRCTWAAAAAVGAALPACSAVPESARLHASSSATGSSPSWPSPCWACW